MCRHYEELPGEEQVKSARVFKKVPRSHDLEKGCRHQWCMRSNNPWGPRDASERNWALLSTQIKLPMFQRGGKPKQNWDIRLVRLAADQLLIHNERTKQAVKKFAANNSAFLEDYGAAFQKMISIGYAPGELKSCSPV